jgi:hypothetical protein
MRKFLLVALVLTLAGCPKAACIRSLGDHEREGGKC